MNNNNIYVIFSFNDETFVSISNRLEIIETSELDSSELLELSEEEVFRKAVRKLNSNNGLFKVFSCPKDFVNHSIIHGVLENAVMMLRVGNINLDQE